MLRVNGSLPIYSVRPFPEHLSELLTSRDGNCADQTFRLLVVLELFSVKGRAIRWHTPSIEGHWFVGAFDEQEGRAYYLDPTNNLMASVSVSEKNIDFFDALSSEPLGNRLKFVAGRMKSFPFLYDEARGLWMPQDEWAADNYVRVRDSTVTGFVYELPLVLEKWKDGKWPRPTTLCTMASEGRLELAGFIPENCLPVDSLLQANLPAAAMPVH
ncbi:hypothetical protein ACR4XJ_07225 [Nitratidesulfovibrio sp. D1]|uniref:hypothetical protein n=1 Tax=Nitratidesulfovibrio sp. D1 TaxID=3440151 RepID=UPI003EBAE6DC